MRKLENMTQEEIDLILEFRKNKLDMAFEQTIKEDEKRKEWNRIGFQVKDNKLHLGTAYGVFDKERNQNTSSSGFFHAELSKSEIESIRNYFNQVLIILE